MRLCNTLVVQGAGFHSTPEKPCELHMRGKVKTCCGHSQVGDSVDRDTLSKKVNLFVHEWESDDELLQHHHSPNNPEL